MTKGKYIRTLETRAKISKSRLGIEPWNKGMVNSKEINDKISMSIREYFKEHPEAIQKISQSKKGVSTWNKGKHLSEEHRHNLSQARMGKFGGAKCHLWRGGLSFQVYTIDWTETLRRAIRERDHYTCQICNALQSDEAFAVHHIDYDKQNCNPDNLITLCRRCHLRTNLNRSYWQKYFEEKNGR